MTSQFIWGTEWFPAMKQQLLLGVEDSSLLFRMTTSFSPLPLPTSLPLQRLRDSLFSKGLHYFIAGKVGMYTVP
ncbi:hypothetical protein BH09BAC6_BH09BAC6_23690 [soil metagenome]